MGATTCKNCNTNFVGNFCPECGQKASISRITLRHSASEFLDATLNLNRGLLPTFRDLLLRPGTMLRGYMAGKRKNYIQPGRFLFFMVALSYLFNFVIFPNAFDRGMAFAVSGPEEEAVKEYTTFLFSQLNQHFTLITISVLPFLAIFSRLFFHKEPYNLAEHIVVATYVTAISTALPVPLFILNGFGVLNGTMFLGLNVIFSVGYTAFAFVSFFQPKSWIWGSIRSLLAFGFGYTTWMILLISVGTVIAIKRGIFPIDLSKKDSLATQNEALVPADSLTNTDSTAALWQEDTTLFSDTLSLPDSVAQK